MKLRETGYLAAFFITAVMVSSAQRAQPTIPHYGEIRGVVRLPGGSPAGLGVFIYLELQGGGTAGQSQTDRQGKFDFQQIQAAEYIVSVRASGFLTEYKNVDLSSMPMAYLVFDMKRDPQSNPSAVPAAGPGASVSALDAAAPDEARKNFESGRDLLTQGKDIPKSIEFFQKAVQQYPQYSQAYLYLGLAFSSQNNWDDAEKALQKSVTLNKDNASALVALGGAENKQKNYQSAEKNLLQAVTLAPDSADAHFELGNTYWALQRWSDADQHVAKANTLRPDNAGQHILMGNILLRERNAEGALKEYKESLRVSPDGPFADSARQMVSKIEAALASSKK